jgi:AraC family transcriptional activator of pobA
MQTPELAVCGMDLFGEDIRHFWMDDLDGLLEKFPQLAFPHKQGFYTLIFVEDAKGEIILDNQKIGTDNAKVIIIPPNCINSISINTQAKGSILCFTDDFFFLKYNDNPLHQLVFLNQDAKPFIGLTNEQMKRWAILTGLLVEEFKLQKKGDTKILHSYLNILLFELARLYSPSGFVRNISHKQDKLYQFEMLIDKKFKTYKLPSVYADLLHISPNYLNKICKEETGQTAGDLIRNRIAVEAQRLLLYSNYSVNEIADNLGFESVSYFVTFFKKHCGLTPEQFRKEMKKS